MDGSGALVYLFLHERAKEGWEVPKKRSNESRFFFFFFLIAFPFFHVHVHSCSCVWILVFPLLDMSFFFFFLAFSNTLCDLEGRSQSRDETFLY